MEKWKIKQRKSGPVNYKTCHCAKCDALVDIADSSKADFTLYQKYNFCPNCRDKKSNIEPSDKKTKEVHKLSSNGWIDAGCLICGYTENIDAGCYLGYNYCPNCGAEFEDKGQNIVLIFGE